MRGAKIDMVDLGDFDDGDSVENRESGTWSYKHLRWIHMILAILNESR